MSTGLAITSESDTSPAGLNGGFDAGGGSFAHVFGITIAP